MTGVQTCALPISGASGKQITENDITNGKSSSSIQLSGEIDGKTIEWKLAKNRKGHAASEDKATFWT